MLEVCPVSLKEANAFVAEHHRHHKPVVGHKFSVGCTDGEKIVGVAIVGRPVSRYLDDGWTLEVNRLCTDGTRNACSILYAAAWRAARATAGSALTGTGTMIYFQMVDFQIGVIAQKCLIPTVNLKSQPLRTIFAVGASIGGRRIEMVVKIKEINEILRDSEDIKITYDSKTHEFKVSLYDLSADFIVKSIAGRTIDASLADIKRYLSKPWYLPAVWIKEIVKE